VTCAYIRSPSEILKLCDYNIILICNNHILGCFVTLCDFHREQAWERWLSATANGMRNVKEIALSLLRKIAASETEEEYASNLESLYANAIWNVDQNEKFRKYFEKTWLPLGKVSELSI